MMPATRLNAPLRMSMNDMERLLRQQQEQIDVLSQNLVFMHNKIYAPNLVEQVQRIQRAWRCFAARGMIKRLRAARVQFYANVVLLQAAVRARLASIRVRRLLLQKRVQIQIKKQVMQRVCVRKAAGMLQRALKDQLMQFFWMRRARRLMCSVALQQEMCLKIQRAFRARDRTASIARLRKCLSATEDRCPITHMAIETPILCLSDGCLYEEHAIRRWVEQHGTSPVTRAVTRCEHLLPPRVACRRLSSLDRLCKRTLHQDLFRAVYVDSVAEVRMILRMGIVSVDLTLSSGLTALHAAAAMNRCEIARLLLRSKAYVNVRDNLHRTPYMYALHHETSDMRQLLCLYNAQVPTQAEVDATDLSNGEIRQVRNRLFLQFLSTDHAGGTLQTS
jgi:hypothetical protein